MNRTQHLAFSGLTIWGADGTIQPRTTRRGGVGAPVGLTVFKTAGGSVGAGPGGFDSHTPLPGRRSGCVLCLLFMRSLSISQKIVLLQVPATLSAMTGYG